MPRCHRLWEHQSNCRTRVWSSRCQVASGFRFDYRREFRLRLVGLSMGLSYVSKDFGKGLGPWSKVPGYFRLWILQGLALLRSHSFCRCCNATL
ncbi:hypothetical protein BDW75DRAFT_196987 [Aspergillus navahoensis]